ncbi:MAG: rhamnulokinase [Lachnospiraceae bacterium]|jgi:rhamnulokinase|nr:rhamnulokinase [Lachnospiraceae bacterium]
MTYYLAVDIGASSGRHMIFWLEDGKMHFEEIYRFPNGMKEHDGHLYWNTDDLFSHIKAGLKKCKEKGMIPSFMGIDTWAVDYVLLDENDNKISEAYGYRDSRTTGMDDVVYRYISMEELYERTGIQKQPFNTIYQLMAHKEQEPDVLKKARTFLMLPDYFNFLLTGIKKSEYTNATTGQLVNAHTNDWDFELIDRLGLPKNIFLALSKPGETVGKFKKEVSDEVGFEAVVMLPATHDTGSAVVAVPSNDDDGIYISSGTWSLMGIESLTPICTLKSMEANFTNEGGYDFRFRFLKNIMGLWMIQSVKKEFTKDLSFADLCELAEEEEIPSIVDCNDPSFLAPKNMNFAVKQYCEKTDQAVPVTEGEMAAVIYNSLAKCYGDTVREIEEITGREFKKIHIIGGGANADYLNKLTAKYTGKKVTAGPTEATAIGNALVMMIANKEFANLSEARFCVKESFDIIEVN